MSTEEDNSKAPNSSEAGDDSGDARVNGDSGKDGVSVASAAAPTPTRQRREPGSKVRFAEDCHSAARPGGSVAKKSRNPARISGGKANVKRDLGIFLAILALMLILSMTTMRDVGKAPKKSSKTEMGKIFEALAKAAQEKQKQKEEEKNLGKNGSNHCGLVLEQSSVPGAGMGVFATRRFNAGEVVIGPGIAYPLFDLPRGNGEDQSQSQSPPIFIPQHSTILNHHPYLANIVGGDIVCDEDKATFCGSASPEGKGSPFAVLNTTALTASRSIESGEELFLRVDKHPRGMYPTLFSDTVPTPENYEMADEIIDGIVNLPRQKRGGGGFGSKPSGGVHASALKLLKETVSKFDVGVAALLPESFPAAGKLALSGSAYGSLKNQTAYGLRKKGFCIDNLSSEEPSAPEDKRGAFTTRFIAKGALITPAPLLVIDTRSFSRRFGGNMEQADLLHSSDSFANFCLGHEKSPLLLCPQTYTGFINDVWATAGQCDSSENSNSRFEWSSWNPKNNRAHGMSIHEVIQEYTTGLSLDLIATRDIKEGEGVVLDCEKETEICTEKNCQNIDHVLTQRAVRLSGALIPESWKTRKEDSNLAQTH